MEKKKHIILNKDEFLNSKYIKSKQRKLVFDINLHNDWLDEIYDVYKISIECCNIFNNQRLTITEKVDETIKKIEELRQYKDTIEYNIDIYTIDKYKKMFECQRELKEQKQLLKVRKTYNTNHIKKIFEDMVKEIDENNYDWISKSKTISPKKTQKNKMSYYANKFIWGSYQKEFICNYDVEDIDLLENKELFSGIYNTVDLTCNVSNLLADEEIKEATKLVENYIDEYSYLLKCEDPNYKKVYCDYVCFIDSLKNDDLKTIRYKFRKIRDNKVISQHLEELG